MLWEIDKEFELILKVLGKLILLYELFQKYVPKNSTY